MANNKLENMTTEMAEYICDDICGKISGKAEDDAAEICDACKINRFINEILKESGGNT